MTVMTKICEMCKVSYNRRNSERSSDWKIRKFCSTDCAYKGRKTNKGRTWSEEVRKRMSDGGKGRKNWLGKKHTGASKIQMSKPRKNMQGKNHPNWKGGISAVDRIIRGSFEYKIWRKNVFTRDGYKCVLCGECGTGRNLNADHIKAFALYPELRLDVNNGRTLCVICHRKTDTYGRASQRNKVA